MEHSSRRGDVLSLRVSTALRMALQCPGWRRDGGDGHTGLMVTEGMRPTSRHDPMRARNRRLPPSRVPPSSFEGAVLRTYESGRHSVAELTLPYRIVSYSGGDRLTGRVGGTAPRYDSQTCQKDSVYL
jgi:hypothetical protein